MGADSIQSVFVYGSLMFDAVWSKVVEGRYESFPAIVANFTRLAVPGETYPAALPLNGANIEGLIWQGVSPSDLERLDAFEGHEYTRIEIEASPVSCTGVRQDLVQSVMSTYPAWIYVWNHPESLTPNQPWDVEGFKNVGLPLFLAKHVGSWEKNGVRQQG